MFCVVSHPLPAILFYANPSPGQRSLRRAEAKQQQHLRVLCGSTPTPCYSTQTLLQAKVAGAESGEELPDGGSAAGGTVKLSDGTAVEYDWLVVSLGSQVGEHF
jgi:hypothetical protein